MPLIPDNKAAAIAFFASHLDAWAGDPGAIGMTAEQVAALAAATDEARATLLAAEEAYNAARSAMAANDAAIAAMRTAGSGAIATIRAYARAAGDASQAADIYARANIPAPRPRTPAGTPDAPTDLRGTIDNRGAVVLRWKGTLADRAFFEVYRMFEGQDAWTLLAAVGAKTWTDEAIPPGVTPAVRYMVQAKRGELRSEPSESVTVRVGVVPTDSGVPEVGMGVGARLAA
ncbi:MAG: hypothetical protein ACF8R9_06700 [Phycisphaerales bacterium JB054]